MDCGLLSNRSTITVFNDAIFNGCPANGAILTGGSFVSDTLICCGNVALENQGAFDARQNCSVSVETFVGLTNIGTTDFGDNIRILSTSSLKVRTKLISADSNIGVEITQGSSLEALGTVTIIDNDVGSPKLGLVLTEASTGKLNNPTITGHSAVDNFDVFIQSNSGLFTNGGIIDKVFMGAFGQIFSPILFTGTPSLTNEVASSSSINGVGIFTGS